MRRRRIAGRETLHYSLELAGPDRALAQQALLGAKEPALVVGSSQIVGRVHLLAHRTPSRPGAETLQAHEHLDGENSRLPSLVIGQLAAGFDDSPEPMHPSHVVHAIHRDSGYSS
jgi:hypothetical protein